MVAILIEDSNAPLTVDSYIITLLSVMACYRTISSLNNLKGNGDVSQ